MDPPLLRPQNACASAGAFGPLPGDAGGSHVRQPCILCIRGKELQVSL